ncbi:phytanoyl-CoA dioxygenase family protein [Sphingomonas canadensis]|uniref:Phytanoyl-CoA dioxygenase family protein n=1 Tax=Sphingomonas canadensis TaxID=1219257 RepID=A0ABW3H718_9SPHN
MADLQSRDADALTARPDALGAKGFAILRGAASGATIARVASDLSPHFEATPFCQGGFYGTRTKRFGRLLSRSDAVAELVLQREVLALAERVLSPWCDTIQLNLGQAIEIHPGALPQFPHRDQDMWRGVTGEVEYLVNVIWPLTPFTRANGATLIWPGTHGAAALESEMVGEPVVAECEPGDAIVFLGSTLHGAGGNVTTAARRAIIVSYCLGWLKPYENQWLAYPPEVARRFPPELAALVGYRQHRPNLGNFEGQCPSILLGDAVPDHIAAIDALRPDQEAMLADYVDAQLAGGETARAGS